MTEAEIDDLLHLLDAYGDRRGGGREQACFHAARLIRDLLRERDVGGPQFVTIDEASDVSPEQWAAASVGFGTAWGSYTAAELRERGSAIVDEARSAGASAVQVRSISAAIAHAEALADRGKA